MNLRKRKSSHTKSGTSSKRRKVHEKKLVLMEKATSEASTNTELFALGHGDIKISSPRFRDDEQAFFHDGKELSSCDNERLCSSLIGFPIRKYVRPNRTGSISEFPEELILSIFKWLPQNTLLSRCALVCKQWQRISKDSSLWKKVVIGKKSLDIAALKRTLACGTESLVIRSKVKPVPGGIIPVTWDVIRVYDYLRFNHVRFLQLFKAKIKVNELNDLLSLCYSLKELGLPETTIDDTTCRYIARNKNLVSLGMSLVSGATPVGLDNIFKNCIKLNSLTISMDCLSEESIEVISYSIPPLLTKLHISGQKALNDNHIKRMLLRCPNVIELDVSDCNKLTSTSINHMIEHGSKLKVLLLNSCSDISHEAYFSLKWLKHLSYLECDHLPVFKQLKNYLPNVKVMKSGKRNVFPSPRIYLHYKRELDHFREKKWKTAKKLF